MWHSYAYACVCVCLSLSLRSHLPCCDLNPIPGGYYNAVYYPESSNIPANREDRSRSERRRNKEIVISRDTVRQIFLPTWQSLAHRLTPSCLLGRKLSISGYIVLGQHRVSRDTTTSALLSALPWACRRPILFLFCENRSIFHNFSISTWMQDILFVLHISVQSSLLC